MAIPQMDPGAPYRALNTENDAAVARVLARGRYILGQEVAGFEAEYRGRRSGLATQSASPTAPMR